MILDQFKLDGKVAIVTGAGRGIGQAYAIGLAEAGADVAIVDVIDMDETIAAIEKLGRKTIGIKADLSKGEKEAPKIVAKVVKTFKKVDILVNNAGIIRREPFAEHSAKNWNDVIAINLSTPFFLSQAVVRQMQKQGKGGKIINIASMLSFQGGILVPGYAASKGGIKSLTMLMATSSRRTASASTRSPRATSRRRTPRRSVRTRSATRRSSTASPQAAGAPRTTSRASACSSPRRRRTT